VLILAREEKTAVRLVLGSANPDSDAPDLHIERRQGGWAVTIHPVGGGDPSGYVYILDDGRTAAAPEMAYGDTPALAMLDAHESPDELDSADAKLQSRLDELEAMTVRDSSEQLEYEELSRQLGTK
jgi:hypothetical protein